jgi:hypothetical protein
MNKFHQIPTDTFLPLSHDNSYLFVNYDKVANFLAFNLDRKYRNILAKPVQTGYVVEWFSVYEGLVNINERTASENEAALVKYWEFKEAINARIAQLSQSNDEDNKNWASLLTKVFNQQDNFIFYNGTDICIVWGWKFDNTKIYKPAIIGKPVIPPVAEEPLMPSEEAHVEPVAEAPVTPLTHEENLPQENATENVEEKEAIVEDDVIEDESGFKRFLKWFASKFWWLLMLLLLLILFFLLFRSCYYNDHVDNRLDALEEKANNICN